MMNDIRKMFGIKKFAVTDQLADLSNLLKNIPQELEEDMQTVPSKTLIRALNTLVGVEVEVENYDGSYPSIWMAVDDNSLRNNGKEFITPLGTRAYQMTNYLNRLFGYAANDGWTVSDRTSIHVHINVCNMTIEEVNSFIILYSLVEDSLFKYAGDFRYHNIFCVPMAEQLRKECDSFESFLENSSKYSALNTKSVSEKGTVEFRHMHTKYDTVHVNRWIIMLCLLRYYARFNTLEEIKQKVIQLKAKSQYHMFLTDIFYGFTKYLEVDNSRMDSLATDAKLHFYGDN